jgi:hypothetical protein
MRSATKFFVPHARDEAMAEDVWQKLRDRHGSTDQRIYSLMWRHKGVTYEGEVGKRIRAFGENAGDVVAIIRGHSCFMVFTVFRGILRDVPVMVGDNEYMGHMEFD